MNSNRDSAALMAASFRRRPGDEVPQCWLRSGALSREIAFGLPCKQSSSLFVARRPRAPAILGTPVRAAPSVWVVSGSSTGRGSSRAEVAERRLDSLFHRRLEHALA